VSEAQLDDVPLLVKQGARKSDEEYAEILQRAFNAGANALDRCAPPESVKIGEQRGKVIWGANMIGRTGQAWVSFPHNSPFVQFIRRAGYGSNVPAGGYGIFIRQGGQDGVYKRAFAKAFAASLNEQGIKAHAHILMD
jgi:hypothetical protein